MSKLPFYIDTNDPPAKRLILEEGLRLFAERGLSSTSIRDIADATGYSNPALYKHFKTKEMLARTLFVSAYKEMLGRVTAGLERGELFDSRFRAYLTIFAEFYDECPHAVIFVSDNLAALWPQISDNFKERTMITITRDLLQQGRREGIVATDADFSLQVILVTGMLSQLARQLFLGELASPARDYIQKMERILRAGLK